MNKQWFVRKGILYFPVSFIGWLISLAAVVYCVYSFIAIDSKSHSASDTLRNFFFIVFIVAVIYSGIAYFANRVRE
jgi:hypothetical protein